MKDSLYTKKEIAGYFTVSVSTVEKWMREGCPIVRLSPNLPRFNLDQVKAWIQDKNSLADDKR